MHCNAEVVGTRILVFTNQTKKAINLNKQQSLHKHHINFCVVIILDSAKQTNKVNRKC